MDLKELLDTAPTIYAKEKAALWYLRHTYYLSCREVAQLTGYRKGTVEKLIREFDENYGAFFFKIVNHKLNAKLEKKYDVVDYIKEIKEIKIQYEATK